MATDTLYLLTLDQAVFVPGDAISDEATERIRSLILPWTLGATKVLVLQQPCDVKDWRDRLPV